MGTCVRNVCLLQNTMFQYVETGTIVSLTRENTSISCSVASQLNAVTFELDHPPHVLARVPYARQARGGQGPMRSQAAGMKNLDELPRKSVQDRLSIQLEAAL